MNEYRGKHAPKGPWAVAATAAPSRRGKHQKRNRKRRIGAIIAACVLLLVLAWPFAEARFMLSTERTVIASADLPQDANHLRIVYLSDIHWGFWYSDGDAAGLINRINGLRPDLVLFGGDYATDHASAVQFFHLVQALPDIRARYGVYGVIGETDCGETLFEQTQLRDAMTAANVIPLVNRTETIQIGSSRIIVAGLDDITKGTPDLRSLARSVSASDYVIFLAHNPSVISDAQQATDRSGSLGWFDLGLFGHTHGGQMMYFSGMLEIAPDVPERYRSGWLTENRSTMLISRGVGTSVVPMRLLCTPQIHLIELTSN